MVTLSTNKIMLKSSSKELFDFLSSLENIADVLTFKKVKHLKIEGDVITFILKWAARFNFTISEITNSHVLIESSKDVEFKSAFQFDITEEPQGASIIIHIETDTAPFVDFYFESQIKKWVAAMAENFEKRFS